MNIVRTIKDLQVLLDNYRQKNKTIGFVPTMGALHQGHISLVEKCVEDNDCCIVSIFVNPTQFNDKNDLINYPRTEESDIKLLEKAGCNIVFIPLTEEIYPEPDTRVFDFGPLENVMEGQFRPGHFNGVAQIVSKLFYITQPDKAYFGEKDFQQLAIIREMVKMLEIPVEIVAYPIVREKDGLAMSSRNARLNQNQRVQAAHISRILFQSKEKAPDSSVNELKIWVINAINEKEELRTEYFEIIDGNTLQPINTWNDTSYAVGCIAVFCGEVRLIDNITY